MIKLTQEQQDNLILIALLCFPNDTFFFENDDMITIVPEHERYYQMHWFEFIIRKLARKAFDKIYKGISPTKDAYMFFLSHLIENDDPVKYLHEQIKDLVYDNV